MVQALNSMLLTCWKDPDLKDEEQHEKKALDEDEHAKLQAKALEASAGRIATFCKIYEESFLHEQVANKAGSLQEDVHRLCALTAAAQVQGEISLDNAEVFSGHKASLLKNRAGAFYKGITLFPVGIFIMEAVTRKIAQAKRDNLLELDLASAVQIAADLKAMTVDTLLRKKGDSSELEVVVPSAAKFAEMASKWLAACETGSAQFKAEHAEDLSLLDGKVLEMKGGLLSVVAHKTREYNAINGFLLDLCGKKALQQEQVVECGGLLSQLAGCQPLQKVSVVKYLGKTYASEVEGCMASSWKMFTCLAKSFCVFVKLTSLEASEGCVLDQQILGLYSMLHDAQVLQNVSVTAPWMMTGLEATRVVLEKNAKEWIAGAASTFRTFTWALMETEPCYFDILNEANFNFDSAGDGEGVTDFVLVSTSLVEPLRAGADRLMEISAPFKQQDGKEGAEKKVKVHASFLCLCGVLARTSKQVLLIKARLRKAAEETRDFPDLLQCAAEALKAKNKDFVFQDKAHILASTVPTLVQLVTSMEHFNSVNTHREKDGAITFVQIDAYYKVLLKKLHELINEALVLANTEVDGVVKEGQSLYQSVAAKHGVPELFQAETLSKQSIQSLVADPAGQKLLLFAARAADSLSGVQRWLADGLRKLAGSPALDSNSLALLSALEKDIDAFRLKHVAKGCDGSGNITLPTLQEFQMSMTMAQAMVRDLTAGETRLGLVGKVYELAKSRGVQMHPNLLKKAQSVLNLKGK